MKQLFLAISLSFAMVACVQKKKADSSETEQPEIRVIDFTAIDFPKKEYKDLAEVEYIPMETRSDVLFDRRYLLAHLSESRIVTSNIRLGDIFVFDGKGKIVAGFNHKGQGAREYLDIGQLVYDEKNRELFVFDRKNRCQVYSEDGAWQRTFEFPKSRQFFSGYGGGHSYAAFDFDGETMLLHNNSSSSDSLFIFLSKKDGSVKSALTLPLSNRIPNQILKRIGEVQWSMTLDFPNICKNGDTYYLSELSSDTIYQLTKDKTLRPLLVRKPPIGKMEDETLDILSILKATDKYILFMFTRYDISFKDSTPERKRPLIMKTYMYEMETQEIFNPSMNFSYAIQDMTLNNASYPENQMATFFSMNYLKEDLEAGRLEGDLREIVEKADEDDNPVLQLIKFRE
ncbi:MAG: 6-bladed beta-propeller [Tannerella sp.]|jgi:hypothetical protein|nr:6-bladed beta-propeller [Tannerella sp.]